MTVASVFEFRFSPETADEGYDVARRIGADMPATKGYIGHDVIRDGADGGHMLVITRWGQQSQAEAVLAEYQHDPKVGRATELLGAPPRGFLGTLD